MAPIGAGNRQFSWTILPGTLQVFSEHSIVKRIVEAEMQLRNTLHNDDRGRGIIAVSITKALNPGALIYAASSEHDVKKGLGDELEELGRKHGNAFVKVRNMRINAVLFHLTTPATIYGLLTAASQIVSFHLPGRTGLSAEFEKLLTE